MTQEKRDGQTVAADGTDLRRLPEGVRVRECVTHVDDRGTVCEIFDPRWNWHPDPVVFVYTFTIRPGKIKGWGLHRKHEDRYFIVAGDMELVLYDERDDSPTRGLVSKLYMSGQRRTLVNIPPGVWHANRNVGSGDVVVVNLPTIPYQHENPDKYRLPLDNDRIPYSFDGSHGW